MFNKFFILLIGILFFSLSCKNTKSSKESKQEKIKKLNEQNSLTIFKKYNCLMNWDTTFRYTYELQERINSGNNIIAFEGIIDDLFEKDSLNMLRISSLRSPSDREFIGDFKITDEMFLNLKNNLIEDWRNSEAAFVIKVQYIIPLIPQIGLNYFSSEDYSDVEIGFSNSNDYLMIKGEVLDYYIYQKLK